jgi:ATP-dependent exoDNAse (exonuclease V) alpha subunit
MQQEKALAIMKSGCNVFLTGSAGTGKTYVLNQYIEYLRERKVPVAVTASTGIAATHMNGLTIHSWAGIGIKEKLTNGNLQSMKSKKYLKKNLEKVKVLIIDEISMLHKSQLNLVDQVLRFFKESTEAFGGIQLVLCGDFFQLPPIGNPGETSRDKFSFMSEAWLKANLSICYLTEQFRQSDSQLNFILNEIRDASVSPASIDLLIKAKDNQLDDEKELTKLFTHNYDVDKINIEHLLSIEGPIETFSAKTKGNKKLVETLKNSVLASEDLQLKVDAKVMFVKNNAEKGYVNGSTGRVLAFNDEGNPCVQMHNGKIITVEPESWTVQDDHSKVLASYIQFPLRLAWAITVHKCQGMTLEEAEVDLSKTFEKGQGYVALSRLKKLRNLRLIGLNEKALEVDTLSLKADRRFKELSAQVDTALNEKELEIRATMFIKECGGLVDPKEIKKSKKRSAEKESSKESTYDLTLAFLKQKMKIKEIAELRGLTEATIAGHFIKIRKDNPDVDLHYYRPKNALINKVQGAYKKQKNSSQVSIKAIYEELNRSVSYNDIKLAIAFFD